MLQVESNKIQDYRLQAFYPPQAKTNIKHIQHRLGIKIDTRGNKTGKKIYTNSKRIRSLTLLYCSPLRSQRGTECIPDRNSETGRHVCPAKSSFSDMSYSCTSIRSRANSGTVKGNVNSSFHTGVQLSSFFFVFFITSSAGTPAIPTCYYVRAQEMRQKKKKKS